jgi:hypothetical protein
MMSSRSGTCPARPQFFPLADQDGGLCLEQTGQRPGTSPQRLPTLPQRPRHWRCAGDGASGCGGPEPASASAEPAFPAPSRRLEAHSRRLQRQDRVARPRRCVRRHGSKVSRHRPGVRSAEARSPNTAPAAGDVEPPSAAPSRGLRRQARVFSHGFSVGSLEAVFRTAGAASGSTEPGSSVTGSASGDSASTSPAQRRWMQR